MLAGDEPALLSNHRFNMSETDVCVNAVAIKRVRNLSACDHSVLLNMSNALFDA